MSKKMSVIILLFATALSSAVIGGSFLDNIVFEKSYKTSLTADSLPSIIEVVGKADKTVDDGLLTIKAHGDAYVIDENSPSISDGEYIFNVSNSDIGRFGAVFRYVSPEKHAFIGYDIQSKWYWSCGDSSGTLTSSGPDIMGDGKTHTVKIRFISSYYKIWVDGNEIFAGAIKSMPTEPGKIGFRQWFNSTASYSDVSVNYGNPPLTQDFVSGEVKTAKIESDVLSVEVDTQFPRVIAYKHLESDSLLYGQSERIGKININGIDFTSKVSSKIKSIRGGQRIHYKMIFPQIGDITIDASLTVSGDTVVFKVDKIADNDQFRVNTIEIPRHGIVSIRSTQPKAVLATAMIDADKSKCGDTFTPITASTEVSDTLCSAAYVILSTDKLAASIETNSVYDYPTQAANEGKSRHAKGSNKVSNGRVQYEFTKSDDVVSVGLSSGQWTYRADMSDKIEPAPFLKVIVTTDRNDDNAVDWQDGAIAFRDIMNNPRGADRMPGRVAQHIPYNFGSNTSNPFLRTLDDIKRVYYITDGLGQMALLKGYQSEGHDSAHSDFGGNIGRRQGGKKEMNILVNEGRKWNTDFGVHLNCTEAYPEAKSFSDAFVNPKAPGWGWLDQSYYIHHRKDLTSGHFAKRINELRQDVPGLTFIYMDVYFGDGWEGLEMARTMQQAGFDVTTEFPWQIEHSAIWSHWSVDMTYGPDTGRGINSQIIRFIRNHQKDMFLMHPLLGHAEIGDFEGWQGRTNFNEFLDKVYVSTLPAKYLQHFLITNWGDHEIRLTDDVRVTDASGKRQIFKGDRLLLEGSVYLLPWEPKAEKKLYHWHVEGGKTTWQLPKSWKKKTVKQYLLTDTGREFVAELPVTDGKITVEAKPKTPYVIYKSKAPANRRAKWGQGSLVKDPCFNDRNMSDWVVEGDKKAVAIDVDEHGRPTLKVAPAKTKASISQKITGLKPGTYSASVWVEVAQGKRKASLTVSPAGGEPQMVWTDQSFAFNYAETICWNRTYMQRMQVRFDIKPWRGSAVLALQVEPGQSSVRFDNIRVIPTVHTEKADCVFFEDFENVDEGWFPFVKGDAGGVVGPTTHLSELHAPYTNAGWNEKLVDDTIEGQWSLKSHNERPGLVYQTIPQNIRFAPGKTYEVSFDYQCAHDDEYAIVIGSGGGDDQKIIARTPIKQQRQTKRYTMTVKPDDDPKVWVGLERTPVKTDQRRVEIDFIMDNFAVRQLD
jgi:endo-alpha-N-acetylgalactosaminidase